MNVLAGGDLRASGSLRPAKESPMTPLSGIVKTYEPSDDGLYRYVGELKETATGELVVDLECPF